MKYFRNDIFEILFDIFDILEKEPSLFCDLDETKNNLLWIFVSFTEFLNVVKSRHEGKLRKLLNC